jgi:hypothetical protein
MGKPKQFDEDKFEAEGVLDFETDFYKFDLDQSLVSISLPMKAVKQTGWSKETKVRVTVEEVKD